MDACGRLCPCWPRHAEAPFSPAEQDFLAAGVQYSLSTMDFVARMDNMYTRVGRDRLAYLLSVPVQWEGSRPPTGWVLTPWIRLCSSWTPESDTAVEFVRKMLQHGACLAVACLEGEFDQPGWKRGSSRHPGRRASDCVSRTNPLAEAVRDPDCMAAVMEGIAQRVRLALRWNGRRARVQWVQSVVVQLQCCTNNETQPTICVGDGHLCPMVPLLAQTQRAAL